jgi:hypothetical protein
MRDLEGTGSKVEHSHAVEAPGAELVLEDVVHGVVLDVVVGILLVLEVCQHQRSRKPWGHISPNRPRRRVANSPQTP